MLSITIREATKDDLPDCINIQVKSWHDAYAGIIDDKYLAYMKSKEYLKKRLKAWEEKLVVGEYGFFVACKNEQIIGFAICGPQSTEKQKKLSPEVEVSALYVSKKRKRKGVGSDLIAHCGEYFERQGYDVFIIWSLKKNRGANRFYEKVGGIASAERGMLIGGEEYETVGYVFQLLKVII